MRSCSRKIQCLSTSQLAKPYIVHIMKVKWYKQTNFYTFHYSFNFWNRSEASTDWNQEGGKAKLLHSCEKRSDYISVASERQWGGSIVTDDAVERLLSHWRAMSSTTVAKKNGGLGTCPRIMLKDKNACALGPARTQQTPSPRRPHHQEAGETVSRYISRQNFISDY